MANAAPPILVVLVVTEVLVGLNPLELETLVDYPLFNVFGWVSIW